MTPSRHQRGTYTPTGWRIIGASGGAAGTPTDPSAPDPLFAGSAETALFALTCTSEVAVKGRPAVERVLDAITEDVRRTWSECPRLVRDQSLEHPPSRFGGFRFDVVSRPGTGWTGELVWRAVHPVVQGAPITTWVVLEERSTFTRLTVRVCADHGVGTVRGAVGAGQAQPRFLLGLRTELPLTWLGSPFGPRWLRTPSDVEGFWHDELANPRRAEPVAVLTPTEDGDYVVDPDDLAWQLLGRARLHVLAEHPLTFRLTDAVGDKRLSCFLGAARAYLPRWSRHDDPYDHPLLLAERLADPVLRARWLGEVGLWMARRSVVPTRILPPPSPPEPAPPGDGPAPPTDISGPGVTPEATHPSETGPDGAIPVLPGPTAEATWLPLLERLSADVRQLRAEELRQLRDELGTLSDHVDRLGTLSAVRSSSTNAIERRLGRLETILERLVARMEAEPAAASAPADAADGYEEDDERPSLLEVVQDMSEAHEDALVFLDDAYRSAGESPYEDPERVRAILDAMARVARRRRDGTLGTSLREAFADLGIDYRAAIARTTPARLRAQYRFTFDDKPLEAEEHIVLGNTYDPRRCLRVYFTSRLPDEPRFVIAHVGRHFEVLSST